MSQPITKDQAKELGFIQDDAHPNTHDLTVVEYNTLVLCFSLSGEVTRLYLSELVGNGSITLLKEKDCTFKNVSRICKALSLKALNLALSSYSMEVSDYIQSEEIIEENNGYFAPNKEHFFILEISKHGDFYFLIEFEGNKKTEKWIPEHELRSYSKVLKNI